METHTTYKRELEEGDRYFITAEVLAYDNKRVHSFVRMYDERQGFLAATIEWLGLHVSSSKRRAQCWPVAVREGKQEFVEAEPCLAVPPETQRQISLQKPI